MRAREFITEQRLDQVHDGLEVASKSLPGTYVITDLKNSDFYDLYRFGIAIAAVRGEQGQNDGVMDGHEPEFRAESAWGEHQVITSFDPNVGKLIDRALSKVGKRGKKLASTPSSDEMDDTSDKSPIKAFKGYKR